MNAKRRKPTKAQMKAKKQAKAPGKIAMASNIYKGRPWAEIVKEAGGRKLCLHIGCGPRNENSLHKSFRGEDWFEVRLDIDPDVEPDVLADMRDLSFLPDEAVHAVWSSHNLEHLYPHEVVPAMEEFHRVLKIGGFILVTLPDIETIAGYVARGGLEEPVYDSPAGPITPMDIIFGLQRAMARGNLFMAHHTAFTAKTLAIKLRDAGFSNIKANREHYDLWASGYKYPFNHPKRVNRMLVANNDKKRLESLPPIPPMARTPHPGQILVKGRPIRSDELDIPPKHWKPLNLGLKKAEQ